MGIEVSGLRPDTLRAVASILREVYDPGRAYQAGLEQAAADPRIAHFVARLDGVVRGYVAAHDYGEIAYVAMMAVDPATRRRGVGDALMRALIAWAETRGTGSLQLDATPAGAALYARHGFRSDGETVLVHGVARPPDDGAPAARPASDAERLAILALDRAAFGAERAAALLRLLADPAARAYVTGTPPTGYVFSRAREIGPLIAPDEEAGRALLDAALAARPGIEMRIVVPAERAALRALLRVRGFVERDVLPHMTRGDASPLSPRLWARANPGQG